MGLRGMPEGELTFENLEVPAAHGAAAAVRASGAALPT